MSSRHVPIILWESRSPSRSASRCPSRSPSPWAPPPEPVGTGTTGACPTSRASRTGTTDRKVCSAPSRSEGIRPHRVLSRRTGGTMNRRPLSLAWTLAAFLGACAPPSPSPLTDEEEARIEAEVLARAETLLDAHRTLDLDRVMEHFTERGDLTYAEAAFIYADREAVREGYFGAFTRGMTSFEGEWIDARVIPTGAGRGCLHGYLPIPLEGHRGECPAASGPQLLSGSEEGRRRMEDRPVARVGCARGGGRVLRSISRRTDCGSRTLGTRLPA